MKLTIRNKLKLCWEILTVKSGHKHTAQEKILSTYIHGYKAGQKDEKMNQFRIEELLQNVTLKGTDE